MDLTAAPEAARGLTDWLSAQGVQPEVQWYEGPSNQRVNFIHASGLVVQLLVDRAQWFLLIGRAEKGLEWFDVELWDSCLHGRQLSRGARTFETQVAWLQENWELLLSLGLDIPLECMREAKIQRAHMKPTSPPRYPGL